MSEWINPKVILDPRSGEIISSEPLGCGVVQVMLGIATNNWDTWLNPSNHQLQSISQDKSY
jgi:hypothetical protein